jgi:Na+/H+ antiporter NhaC
MLNRLSKTCSNLIFARFSPIWILLLLNFPDRLPADTQPPFTIQCPRIILKNIPFTIKVQPSLDFFRQNYQRKLPIILMDGASQKIIYSDSLQIDSLSAFPLTLSQLTNDASGKSILTFQWGDKSRQISQHVLPPILSILPPLLAILLALITRQVILALFFGIWLGVTFIYDFNPLLGILHTLDEYIVNALLSPDRIAILIFSLVLGGMVGVISRSGGTQGIVEKLKVYAKSVRMGQLVTWAMGIIIFFDDYANTLIVGNTMRPLTDKLKISREKLSYFVDSTAAPVANIAIISTWIGYEISLINQSFSNLGITDNAYITFIKTIPYNFYPIYAIFFGFFVAYLLRDFGSMYWAEQRARQSGTVLREGAMPLSDLTTSDMVADENTPLRWYNALIPIAVVILAVILGLVYTGYAALSVNEISLTGKGWLQQISLVVGNADSFAVLMWASFLGSITAILLAIFQRILNIQQALEAWVKGIRSMIMAAIILTCAWSIGMICQDLFTADYVIHLTRQFLTPHWLPLITFLTAAIISFATGTSWGTMAILMPIAIPLAFKFPLGQPDIDPAHATNLMLSTTAAVLAGATFGDHCSPISDTTIMSSMASGADHIDHVRTQLPYALSVALIATFFGYLPVGFGISDWWVLGFGILATFLVVRFVGKKTG